MTRNAPRNTQTSKRWTRKKNCDVCACVCVCVGVNEQQWKLARAKLRVEHPVSGSKISEWEKNQLSNNMLIYCGAVRKGHSATVAMPLIFPFCTRRFYLIFTVCGRASCLFVLFCRSTVLCSFYRTQTAPFRFYQFYFCAQFEMPMTQSLCNSIACVYTLSDSNIYLCVCMCILVALLQGQGQEQGKPSKTQIATANWIVLLFYQFVDCDVLKSKINNKKRRNTNNNLLLRYGIVI